MANSRNIGDMVPIVLKIVLVLLSIVLPASQAQTVISPVPSNIKSQYGLASDWYYKYVDAWGLPIFGSRQIDDRTLQKVHKMLGTLLWTNPYWPIAQLNKLRVRVVIIARNEKMSSIPEIYRLFGTTLDARMWAGFGGTPAVPFSTGTESNIMDNHGSENVFVHEFGHTLHLCALTQIDPGFLTELQAAYYNARSYGLWKNTYAISNIEEYFAEGVQTYFNGNYNSRKREGDGVHNDIDTREKLGWYDRSLYKLLDRIYRGRTLQA